MIAGTLAVLEGTADAPLESAGGEAFTTLDVRETLTYLDGATVQHGRACAHVNETAEKVHVDGDSTISTEQVSERARAYTECVADVTDAGFLVTSRTAGSDPTFPFDVFRNICGTDVVPVDIDTKSFIEAQHEADNSPSTWFSGSKTETGDDEPNDVNMGYGRNAVASGNVGVGFSTDWNGRRIKGILYASGYVAIYSDWVGEAAFAQFVREELLAHTTVPDEARQDTLGGDA